MKPGLYTVEYWNNKDAVLISEDGEFLSITKNDLPKEFGGQLFVGEKVEAAIVLRAPNVTTLDERARASRNTEISKQTLAAVHLDDGDFYRPIAALYKKNKVLSPAMKQFLSILREGH